MESQICKLFDSKNRRFEIPSYQRAYSWEEKQINQFIEDLGNARNNYYLGHFLFEEKSENTLYIIDGQQRLTTIVIFFSVLRKELERRLKKGEKVNTDLDDIEDYYLKDLRKGTQKFRTIRNDNNFFLDEIIENKEIHNQVIDTTSKQRIRNAKEIFEKAFSKVNDVSELERWCTLVENATITEYVVKDKIQATQIFAFQNDRGKKLSNLEIIKAYFMLQIYLSNDDNELIEEGISYLEVEISSIYIQIERVSINEDEILNYYWRTVSGKGFYSDEVIKGIKDKISKLTTNKTKWMKDFISGLAQAFKTIESIEKSSDKFINDLLYLNNMALSYPFFIKAYKLGATAIDIAKLSRLLENITFRYLLRGGRAEIESRLNHYLVNFPQIDELNNIINEIVTNIKSNGWWSYWSDNSISEYLDSGYFYKNRVDNYLLWKYELWLSDDKGNQSPLNYTDVMSNESIEHIAPQNPPNGQQLGTGYGTYSDDIQPSEGIESGNWLNCVGNLMLMSQSHNSHVGNKPFSEKLASYEEVSALKQHKEIRTFLQDVNNPGWDKTAIEKRHKKILSFAKKNWKLQ